MESDNVKGNIELEKKNPEVDYEDDKIIPEEKTADFSSSSSSSSSSIGFDIDEKGPFDDSSVIYKSDENPLSEPESDSSPDIPTHTPWSMLSASLLSQELSTVSPVQTMEQPGSYDPNRIPASVFSTKPTNPSDWSAASNESLFSIHMGNNSFSRENSILFWKSGELNRLDEWNHESKSSELSSLPPVIEASSHEESCLTSDEISRLENEKTALTEVVRLPPIATKAPALAEINLTSSNTPGTSASNTRLSNESGNSCRSFAFPVLVSDAGKTYSLKEVVEEQPKKAEELEEQVSYETPQPFMTRWFSWFSCWPRCC